MGIPVTRMTGQSSKNATSLTGEANNIKKKKRWLQHYIIPLPFFFFNKTFIICKEKTEKNMPQILVFFSFLLLHFSP